MEFNLSFSMDNAANIQRILWIACGDIAEGNL